MKMVGKCKQGLLAVSLATLLVAAGCGSSSTSRTAASGGKTFTVGVLTDVTGAAAASDTLAVQGVQAGIVWAKSQGYTIKYILADTTSTPAGTLEAAQKLVLEDHVSLVITDSGLTFAAAPFLTSKGIPVIGAAQDGPEWQTSSNMFAVYGALHTNLVSTDDGLLFKMEGATNIGSVGYAGIPSSSESARGAALSAQAVGLKVGYLNDQFPLGSTNVLPAVLAMKSAGVNGFTAATASGTAYAFVTALHQEGVQLKVVQLNAGYGIDLQQAAAGTKAAAQGAFLTNAFEPIEMHTPATEEFAKALKSIGQSADPDGAEYNGYVSVMMLVQALKAAGANPTSASLMQALSEMHSFNAGGLLGSHSLDINDRTSVISGVDNCEWFVKYEASTFHLVAGADPLCGKQVPGESTGS